MDELLLQGEIEPDNRQEIDKSQSAEINEDDDKSVESHAVYLNLLKTSLEGSRKRRSKKDYSNYVVDDAEDVENGDERLSRDSKNKFYAQEVILFSR